MNNNALTPIEQVFAYGDAQVRVVIKDGEPWFVAKDVCDVLEIGNYRNALARLSDSMKDVHTMDTLGGNQLVAVVNEPGVYKIMFTSRKPEAERFTNWLATEVIPSIRKTGSYSIQQQQHQLPQTYLEALKAHVEAVERAEAAEQQLALAAPKVEFHDRFMSATNAQTMEQVAKTVGVGRNTLFAFLRHKGIFTQANLPSETLCIIYKSGWMMVY